MIAFLILVFHVVVSPLKTQARLEAAIIMLRHQFKRAASAGSLETEVRSSRPAALCLALSPVPISVERHRCC